MKQIIIILFFLPLIGLAQKIRINEFDKFIKQRRIESFPLTIASAAQIKMAVSLSSVGSSLYLQSAGSGLGANRIEAEDKVIFLLDNDSTITIKSKGYQNFDIGTTYNSYKHHYIISFSDLQKLMKHNLLALRKYRSEDFDDVFIGKELSNRFKKLCETFIIELTKSNVSNVVRTIDHKQVGKHIGDSVVVIGTISGGRYFPNSEEAVTLLNVGEAYPSESFSIVIRGIDRVHFEEKPERFYEGKLVRVVGKVEEYNKRPQIKVSSEKQLEILSDSTAKKMDNLTSIPPQIQNEVKEEKLIAVAPAFPGGAVVWADFLKRNLIPPSTLKIGDNKIVVVRFLVKADGTVENIEIVQSGGVAYDKEVLRVLKRMPKWKASLENGRPVDAVVTQTVTFYSKDVTGVL